MRKKVILTADDFGYSLAVNQAIEKAHLSGVLSTASLMVGASAAGDAVVRARRLPLLHVGLHVVLVDGTPTSPIDTISSLVDSSGAFPSHLFRAGVNFYFRAQTRRHLEQEIRAQFQAFRDAGLVLDHVNCHKHMHLHPSVGLLLLKVGSEYGMRTVRYPYEPFFPSWQGSRKDLGKKLLSGFFLWPWRATLKRKLNQAQVRYNDFVFGMNDSGNMNLNLVLRFLGLLPSGITEIYFHPAAPIYSEGGQTAAGCRGQDEFAALTSSALEQALRDFDIERTFFSDL